MRAGSCVVALAVAATTRLAHAEPGDAERLPHGLVTAAGAGLYLTLEFVLKDAITPDACRWCASNALDDAARAVRWSDGSGADAASNFTGFIAAPALATVGLVLSTATEPSAARWFDNVVPVVQAGVVTGLVNQLAKISAGRQRPYAHHGTTAVQPDGDDDTSFFSGHTSLAFALAVSSGTVASLRGYRSAPILWAGGLALATATGYLRMAADAHYLTDVLVGAAIGSAIGVALPRVLHGDRLRGEVATVPLVGGGVVLSFGRAF